MQSTPDELELVLGKRKKVQVMGSSKQITRWK